MPEVDAVVSLAAVCNPAQYVDEPLFTIKSNFLDAYGLVDLCAEHGTWLIHASTCEVYGRTIASYVPGQEYDDPRLYEQVEGKTPMVHGPTVNQRWCYATAESLLERYIYAHHTDSSLPFTIFRPYNWFGSVRSKGCSRAAGLKGSESRNAAPVAHSPRSPHLHGRRLPSGP